MTNETKTFGLSDDQLPRTNGECFFCGCRALCLITGSTAHYINRWVAKYRLEKKLNRPTNPTKIKTMWWEELESFLTHHRVQYEAKREACNYRWIRNRDQHGNEYDQMRNMRPSLSKWVRKNAERGATYLIRVTGHFLVVHDKKVYDYNGDGVSITNHRYARHKVTDILTIQN